MVGLELSNEGVFYSNLASYSLKEQTEVLQNLLSLYADVNMTWDEKVQTIIVKCDEFDLFSSVLTLARKITQKNIAENDIKLSEVRAVVVDEITKRIKEIEPLRFAEMKVKGEGVMTIYQSQNPFTLHQTVKTDVNDSPSKAKLLKSDPEIETIDLRFT